VRKLGSGSNWKTRRGGGKMFKRGGKKGAEDRGGPGRFRDVWGDLQ